jgi:hypothetical protein
VATIDRYLAGLAAALHGPRRVKADLLAEARDSLRDAADAYQQKGMTAAAAQRHAVAEFGDLAEIAPAYQAELAVAQGRRTALLIAVGLVSVYVGTSLAWSGYGGWLTSGFRGLCLGGAVLAALARLGFGWGSRYVPDGVALTRGLGRAALAFLGLHGLAGLGVYLSRLAGPQALAGPGGLAGAHGPEGVVGALALAGAHSLATPSLWMLSAAMAAGFGYAAFCAWRCVQVTLITVRRCGP